MSHLPFQSSHCLLFLYSPYRVGAGSRGGHRRVLVWALMFLSRQEAKRRQHNLAKPKYPPCLFHWDKASLCSPGWHGTYDGDQTGFELRDPTVLVYATTPWLLNFLRQNINWIWHMFEQDRLSNSHNQCPSFLPSLWHLSAEKSGKKVELICVSSLSHVAIHILLVCTLKMANTKHAVYLLVITQKILIPQRKDRPTPNFSSYERRRNSRHEIPTESQYVTMILKASTRLTFRITHVTCIASAWHLVGTHGQPAALVTRGRALPLSLRGMLTIVANSEEEKRSTRAAFPQAAVFLAAGQRMLFLLYLRTETKPTQHGAERASFQKAAL